MDQTEIQDPSAAERFLLQGLWLQRIQHPNAVNFTGALGWCLEIASTGNPLPPPGFVADVGNLVFTLTHAPDTQSTEIIGWPDNLVRAYEDYVLGKLFADWNFERAADALRRFQGRDRSRGLAYLVNHMRERVGFGGVLVNPAIIKSLLNVNGDELLARGWGTLQQRDGIEHLTIRYENLIAKMRRAGDTVGPEDVFELEHGIALAEFGQRFALRQVLQAAEALGNELPQHGWRRNTRSRQAPTHIFDEDTYPVGGFSSIANRGTIESLLHSELTYMEPDDRPDLFDVKYVRDELLYYARDENEFLRRRQSFVFVLCPDLAEARIKDPDLPWQRIVLALAFTVTAVRKLIELLSEDSLLFDIVFLEVEGGGSLSGEQELLEMVLSDQITNGTVEILRMPEQQFRERCAEHARRSLCRCIIQSVSDQTLAMEEILIAQLIVGRQPALTFAENSQFSENDDEPFATWTAALRESLQYWI